MVSPIQQYDYSAGIGQRVNAPAYRPALAAPNTKTYWVEFASCQSLPAEIFEPVLNLGSIESNIEESNARYEQARQACNDCPVWHLCYAKAEPTDFFYTTRAGIKPGQLEMYEEEGERPWEKVPPKKKCAKGHNNWKVWGKKRPRRKCVDCSNENSAKQRAKEG